VKVIGFLALFFGMLWAIGMIRYERRGRRRRIYILEDSIIEWYRQRADDE